MAVIDVGQAAAIINSETAPSRKDILWGYIANPTFPEIITIRFWDDLASSWVNLADATHSYMRKPVLDMDLSTPPGAPGVGDRYVVATGGTGDWSGHDDDIAEWGGSAWIFDVPQDGYMVIARDESQILYDYRTGTGWFANDFTTVVDPSDFVLKSSAGQALGYADLDSSGLIDDSYLDHNNITFNPASPASWPGGTDTLKEALDHLIGTIGGYAGVAFVADIATRDGLSPASGQLSYVTDASGDATVGTGAAAYLWNGSIWLKTYEQESIDFLAGTNDGDLLYNNAGVVGGFGDYDGTDFLIDANLVLKNTADPDPTGANGMMYYNTTGNKFRVYENGGWEDLITTSTPLDYWKTSGTTTLSGTSTINTDSFGVVFSGDDGFDKALININPTGFIAKGGANGDANYTSLIEANVSGVILRRTDGATGASIAGITITDNTGAIYDADYSANFTALSLIDKGYADGAYWKTSGSTTITANVDINSTGAYDVNIGSLVNRNNKVQLWGDNEVYLGVSTNGTTERGSFSINTGNWHLWYNDSAGNQQNMLGTVGSWNTSTYGAMREMEIRAKGSTAGSNVSSRIILGRGVNGTDWIKTYIYGGSAYMALEHEWTTGQRKASLSGGSYGFYSEQNASNQYSLLVGQYTAKAIVLDPDNITTYGGPGINVIDTDEAIGFVYKADYSTNGSVVGGTGARWIPDKGYNDGAYWKTSDTTTLSAASTIAMGNNDLTFNFNHAQEALAGGLFINVSDTVEVNRYVQLHIGNTSTQSWLNVTASYNGGNEQNYLWLRDYNSALGYTNSLSESVNFLWNAAINNFIFSDGRTTKVGLEYDATTATGAGFSDNSLINKGFADGAYWLNGVSNTLTPGAQFEVNQVNSGNNVRFSWGATFFGQVEDAVTVGNNSQWLLNKTSAVFKTRFDGGTQVLVSTSSAGILLSDTHSTSGAYYATSYATDGILDHGDRWIPDKGYNDSVYWRNTANTLITGASIRVNVANNSTLQFRGNSFSDTGSVLQIDAGTKAAYDIRGQGDGGVAYLVFDLDNKITLGAGVYFRDTRTVPKGMFYLGNYDTGGIATHGDDWIPSYRAVKAYADSVAGAFSADAQTQITPSTAIVLDEATGNEIALDLSFEVDKLTSGTYTGLKIHVTETDVNAGNLLLDLASGLTPTSVFRITSGGNILIGNVATYPWSAWNVLESGEGAVAFNSGNALNLIWNAYIDGGGPKYKTADSAVTFNVFNGEALIRTAPSGLADATITWANATRTSHTDFIVYKQDGTNILFGLERDTDNAYIFGGSPTSFGTSAQEVLYIHNAATAPSTAPTAGGGVLFSEGEVLKWWSVTSGEVDLTAGGDPYFVSNSAGTLPSASGTDALAMGESAVASGDNSIAIGNTAQVTFASSVAIGDFSTVGSTFSVALGSGATSDGGTTIAIGYNSDAGGNAASALGASASAQASTAIAIGNAALVSATSTGGIAIGYQAGSNSTGADGTYPISIGYNANQGSNDIGATSIAIGYSTETVGQSSIAIGNTSFAYALDAIAIGTSATAQSYGVSIGSSSDVTASQGVAVGYFAQSTAIQAVAVGDQSRAKANYAISLGSLAGSTSGTMGAYTISIGYDANGAGTIPTGASSVAIGALSYSEGAQAVALGPNTHSTGLNSIGIGNAAISTATGSVAIGNATEANGSHAIAIGYQSGLNTDGVDGNYSITIGYNSNSTASQNIGSDVIALGRTVNTISNDAIAIGLSASVSAFGGQAIGRGTEATSQGAMMYGYSPSATITNARTDSFALGWDETIPSLWIEKYTTTTTGVAGTATMDIPLDASSTYTIEVLVTGGESDASGTMFGSFRLTGGFYRLGSGNVVAMNTNPTGAASSMATAEGIVSAAAGGTEAIDAALSVSTTNVRITVTGPSTTSTNMNWRAVVKLTKVASATS